jgi:hypothetical protein
MPDYIKINGLINGEPELYSYVRSCEIIFSLELSEDLPELNKKRGDQVVVHYSSKFITYVRKGDQIEIKGKKMTRHLKHSGKTISYIEAHLLYNETLDFSFDY